MNCIRRSHSVWTTCPCPPCRTQKARIEKLRRNGLLPSPDSAAAWERVDRWIGDGWTCAAIESAAGLNRHAIEKATQEYRSNGYRQRFGRVITARILAADITTATAGFGPALGSTRRLQALARIGWTLHDIHTTTGVPMMTLSVLRAAKIARTQPQTMRVVAGVYESMSARPGGSARTRATATAAGWSAPLAWDDDVIDDPTAVPQGLAAPARINSPVDHERIAQLTADGLGAAVIAQMLGCSTRAVTRSRARGRSEAA